MSGNDINPEFYALLRRSDLILAELRQLQSDPTNVDWYEVQKYSRELATIADQMEALLPLLKKPFDAQKKYARSANAQSIYLDDGRI